MDAEKLKYRPHIDGLRAFAVIVVFLFHLNPELFPGGYLGVDVFFVISGFVITQSLYKNYLKTGQVNIGQFYIRRFWRLYPALITMILATTSLYFFFGFVWDTNLLIKSSITSIFAVSNLYYLHQAENYFHQDLINPLLHTWSLGIEEQFYIIYPLLLLTVLFIFFKFSIKRTYLSLLFLLSSIVLYLIFYFNQNSLLGDFYFPTARFWELGAGCSLFFLSLDFGSKYYLRFVTGPAFALLGAVLIFQQYIANLHIELLVTVFATAVLIFSGLQYSSFVIRLLEHPKVVFVGAISYSVYLWHLPVIYFSNLYLGGVWYYFSSVLFTVWFAVLSYRYIENRFRYGLQGKLFFKRVVSAFLGMSVVLIVYIFSIGLAGFTKQVNTYLNAFSKQVDSVNYIESQFSLANRIQPDFFLEGVDIERYCTEDSADFSLENGIRTECLKKTGGSSVIYLTGDSHASHFIPMLDASELPHDVYFNRFPRRAIVNADGLPIQTDKSIQERKEELQALASRYDTVYYMTSLFLTNGSDQPETMERNLTRSNKGVVSSAAIDKTRLLKFNHVSSRFKKSAGSLSAKPCFMTQSPWE